MAHTSPLRSTEPGSAALDVDVGAPVAVPEVEPVLELEPELEAVLVPAGLVAVGEPDDCDSVDPPPLDDATKTLGKAVAVASEPASSGAGWPMDGAALARELKALRSLVAPAAGGLIALCATLSVGETARFRRDLRDPYPTIPLVQWGTPFKI